MTQQRIVRVNADLTVEINDERLSVKGDGQRIVIEFSSARSAFIVWRHLKATVLSTVRATQLSSELNRQGLVVEITTPKRKLVTIGSGSGSWFLRLFGVRHTSLHLG